MIYYIAGISRQRRGYPHLLLTSKLDASSWGAMWIRETSFTSHFEIGLHIYGVVNHTVYMQEYRSGHNEAVLKFVLVIGKLHPENP